MNPVFNSTLVYVILLLILRFSGKRTLGELGSFDFVLLLIISEATQQALVGDDTSLTSAVLVIGTLVFIDMALARLKRRAPRLEQWLEGVPVMLIFKGKCQARNMSKELVSQDDILVAARQSHGLERLEQIKYAILEKEGGISVIKHPE